MMTPRVLCATLLLAATAFASEEAAPHGEHHEQPPAPEFVLEHVADAEHFEVDLPWGGELKLHISNPFESLIFERVPGACTAELPPSQKTFPQLFRFIGGCWDLRPTKAVLMIFASVLVLIYLARRTTNNIVDGVARGALANAFEAIFLFIRNDIATAAMGAKEAQRYTPYLASVFFFILSANWLGLIPSLYASTGALAVTLGLAILTFILAQAAGIRAGGLKGYLGHLTGGVPPWMWPLMIPVEVIGLFTKPFALSVRLFANMAAGHLSLFFIIALIFMIHPLAAFVSVPMAAGLYLLEIFVGILQAYIFTLLSALYISQGLAMAHHHGDSHGDSHGHDEAHDHKAHA